ATQARTSTTSLYGQNVSNTAGAPASPAAYIQTSLIYPQTVNYGETIPITISLDNCGGDTAKNVHLVYKVTPGGYFMIQGVTPVSRALSQDSEVISIGDLATNKPELVNMILQLPYFEQAKKDWTKKFVFDFSIAVNGRPAEFSCGVIALVGRGKITLQNKGNVMAGLN
ncbi:MAG: hypothetical protein PHG36_09770, partial [Dehalococcoidia bacterium]|nr:hypothetical protein [Dehalococcoidia bacterium]